MFMAAVYTSYFQYLFKSNAETCYILPILHIAYPCYLIPIVLSVFQLKTQVIWRVFHTRAMPE